VEEFGPTFLHVKCVTNTGALVEGDKNATEVMAEVYDLEQEAMCPITYNISREAQVKEFPEISAISRQ
jgi:uncharacterized OsmC-like protein